MSIQTGTYPYQYFCQIQRQTRTLTQELALLEPNWKPAAPRLYPPWRTDAASSRIRYACVFPDEGIFQRRPRNRTLRRGALNLVEAALMHIFNWYVSARASHIFHLSRNRARSRASAVLVPVFWRESAHEKCSSMTARLRAWARARSMHTCTFASVQIYIAYTGIIRLVRGLHIRLYAQTQMQAQTRTRTLFRNHACIHHS